MAILEKFTDNYYYKINTKETFQDKNNGLIAISVDIYQSTGERNKEKERLPLIKQFNNQMNVYFDSYYSNLAEDAEVDEFIDSLFGYFNQIQDHFYSTIGEDNSILFIPGNYIKEFNKFGFQTKWILEPIKKKNSQVLYFYEENIKLDTTEDFYNFLKTKMNNSIENI